MTIYNEEENQSGDDASDSEGDDNDDSNTPSQD